MIKHGGLFFKKHFWAKVVFPLVFHSLLKYSQLPVVVFLWFWDKHISTLSKKLKRYSDNCVSPQWICTYPWHTAQCIDVVLEFRLFWGFGFDSPLTVFTCALSLRGQRSLCLPEKEYVGCSLAAEGWGNPLIRDWPRESIASNRLLLLKYSTGPLSCNKKSSFLFKESWMLTIVPRILG